MALTSEATAIIAAFAILFTILAIGLLFYILRSRQRIIPREPLPRRGSASSLGSNTSASSINKRPPSLIYYPSVSGQNYGRRPRSTSVDMTPRGPGVISGPRGYIARVSRGMHKMRPRSFSPIRVSPSRPVVFAKGNGEEEFMVTLTVTPPTPGKRKARDLEEAVEEVDEDGLLHNMSDSEAESDEDAYGGVELEVVPRDISA